MEVKAKAEAKAKAKAKAIKIDKYAQIPRSLQAAAKMLDERDLTLHVQEALNNRRHRDERIEGVPEHRGQAMDMRTIERTVDRVSAERCERDPEVPQPAESRQCRSLHRNVSTPPLQRCVVDRLQTTTCNKRP